MSPSSKHMSVFALFPGQGSQFVGMGKTLCETFPLAREVFEEASDATQKNLKRLCFDGPESDLKLTENTQPCLLTASVAAFRVLQKETGFEPHAVAGHSLGEYSALVAAGAIPLAAAAAWVQARGQAMQEAVPQGQGGMAAVMGLEDDTVRALCQLATRESKAARTRESELTVDAVVEAVNFNAPGQVVIAGSQDAVERAIALLKTSDFSGGKAIPLPVSAPFHSSLMKPARDRMAALFGDAPQSARPKALLYPYLPNRTARLTAEPGVVFELLTEQVDHAVLWRTSMEEAFRHGARQFVEIGPGKVLQGLLKRISKPLSLEVNSIGVEDPASIAAFEPWWTQAKGTS